MLSCFIEKVMERLAICNELFGDLPFRNICEVVQGLGYDGIELAPFTFGEDVRNYSASSSQEIQTTAEEFNLQITALHWLLVSPKGLHITSPNPVIFNETCNFFRSLVEFAHDVGASVMVFGSPQQRSILSEWDHTAAYQQGVRFYQEMGDYARKYDITIAFEPLGPSVTNFGGTTADAISLLNEINHQNVKLHLDIAAMMRDPESITDQLGRVPADLLAYVHVNDPNQLGPGMGELDLQPILRQLSEMPYSGWYSVETFAKDSNYSPKEIARESITNMRRYWANKK